MIGILSMTLPGCKYPPMNQPSLPVGSIRRTAPPRCHHIFGHSEKYAISYKLDQGFLAFLIDLAPQYQYLEHK